MKFLKNTGIVLLTLVCVGVMVYMGYFLLRVLLPQQTQPPLLQEEELFPPQTELPEEQEQEELPAPEKEEQTTAPVQEQPAAEKTAEEKALEYMQSMTPEEKLWQLFFVTPEQLTGVGTATRAGDTTKNALAEKPVGGICYFADNLEDREQVIEMLGSTKQYAETPLFLSVDEEGGVVSRLGDNEALGTTKLDAASVYGQADDKQAVFDVSSALAGQMLSLGFNMNFAPVADLAVEGNQVIGTRAYSSDPAVVGRMSAAMATGLQNNGIVACLKHFPGHGSAIADTHDGPSYSSRTLEQLRADEFPAFQAGIDEGVHFVMMAHLINENFSSHPAGLSPEVVSLLRTELGFEGIIITDSLAMKAITNTYSADDAAVMAMKAGCDMILIPNSLEKAYEGLEQALMDGTLTQARIDESVLRILTVKYEMGIMQ